MSSQASSPLNPPANLLVDNPAKAKVDQSKLTERGKAMLKNAPDKIFVMQTNSWFHLHNLMLTAVAIPFELDGPAPKGFEAVYGKFQDEAAIEGALTIFSQLNKLQEQYGNPLVANLEVGTIYDQAKGSTPPQDLYAAGLWLAAKIETSSANIVNFLDSTFKQENWGFLGNNLEQKKKSIHEAFKDGMVSHATELGAACKAYLAKLSAFFKLLYDALDSTDAEAKSLANYLKSSHNLEKEVETIIGDLNNEISTLHDDYEKAKAEYIGFLVAACAAPLFMAIPVFGVFIAAADAIGFGVAAGEMHKKMENLGNELAADKGKLAQKVKLKSDLLSLDKFVGQVKNLGDVFLDAVKDMETGFGKIEESLTSFTDGLTEKELDSAVTFVAAGQLNGAKNAWKNVQTITSKFIENGIIPDDVKKA